MIDEIRLPELHFVVPVMVGLFVLLSACAGTEPAPPMTRIEAVRETLHGVEVEDPYRWLEEQESPETRRWIEAQNRHTDSLLDPLPMRVRLAHRFAELLGAEQLGAPLERAGRYFVQKRRQGEERFVVTVREGLAGREQTLLDPRELGLDEATSLELLDVAADGRVLLYAARQGGEDELALHLFDVDHRRTLETLPRALYLSIALAPDGKAIYYAKQSAAGPRLYHHVVGAAAAEDRELFGAGYGPEKILIHTLSDDGRHLVAIVYYGAATDRSDLFVCDLHGDATFRPVAVGMDAVFEGQVAGGRLYIKTNWQAPGGRILAADLADLAPERWREIVPERQDAVIEGFAVVAGRLLVIDVWQVQSRVLTFSLEGKELATLDFGSVGSVVGARGRFESDELFIAFSSMHRPTTIFRLDLARGEQSVWAAPSLPFDASSIEANQVWFTSKDGTRVPMFVVHKKGLPKDGNRPTLLSGYGGFNVSLTPVFSSTAAVWVEQGGVYALANLRGGGEFGEAWHEAGMREKKQNVFDDFYAAAEWLIHEGYTRPEKLAASGGSNGGLLVGALATQRPELARAILCSYPLLDMVRYHRFLVASYWIPEYGFADDPDQFRVLYAYSPYHHVRSGVTYPAVLFITGDGDTRVAPLHARKMAARMQRVATPGRPILLRYHTAAGHAGAEPTSKQVENQAEALAFLLWQLGESEATGHSAMALSR